MGLIKAGGAVMGPLAWSFAGLVYIAETGVNYRKLKRGEIDKKEFKRRAIFGAIGKVSSVIGSSIGATVGFLIGTAILPGIGTIIGVVVGGVSGSLIISAITVKSIARIERRIRRRKGQIDEPYVRFPKFKSLLKKMVHKKIEEIEKKKEKETALLTESEGNEVKKVRLPKLKKLFKKKI